MKNKEAIARIKINRLLEQAGWRFFDDGKGPANIELEPNIKLVKSNLEKLGENFEKLPNGFVDFLLLDERGKPFIVLEAKKDELDPLVGKEQARKYARSMNVKCIILSNGDLHYFWNIKHGSPQIIVAFPSYESLKDKSSLKYDTKTFIDTDINPDYIVKTMMPNYDEMPEYKNEKTRDTFIKTNKLPFLRSYQVKAIKSIQQSMNAGN